MSNVVDSSGRFEYFAGSPNASFFAAVIEDVGRLIVPSITINFWRWKPQARD
jgi:hypothetical protein